MLGGGAVYRDEVPICNKTRFFGNEFTPSRAWLGTLHSGQFRDCLDETESF